MLAYRIIRALKQAWKGIDLTVEEGLRELDRICAMQLSVKGGGACLRIPELSPIGKELLGALDLKLPLMLPKSTVEVDTKRKLASRRKSLNLSVVCLSLAGEHKREHPIYCRTP